MVLKNIKTLLFVFLAVLFAGCEKSPVNRIIKPVDTVSTTVWNSPYVIYDYELKVGGDIEVFTSQEGMILDFDCREDPALGTKCIKFSWDGSEVTDLGTNGKGFTWTAFGLAVKDPNTAGSLLTKDISAGNYTKLQFKMRGSLNTNVKVRLKLEAAASIVNQWESNLGDHKITNEWKQWEFNISGSQAKAIEHYLIVSFEYGGNTQGNGGSIFLSDIKYAR